MASTSYNIPEVSGRLTSQKRNRSDSESSTDERSKRPLHSYLQLLSCANNSDSSSTNEIMQRLETEDPHDTPLSDTCTVYATSDQSDTESVVSDVMAESISDISSGHEASLPLGAVTPILCNASEHGITEHEEESDVPSTQRIRSQVVQWEYCIRCKKHNSNCFLKYCRSCYLDRRALFPPPPKPFKKRSELGQRKHQRKTDSRPRTPLVSDEEEHIKIENQHGLEIDMSLICNENLRDSDTHENYNTPELNTSKEEKLKSTAKTDIEDEAPELESDGEEMDPAMKIKKDFHKKILEATKDLCIICASAKKDAIFVHGTTGHQACCYPCAVQTWKVSKCCPVCKAKVRNIFNVFS